MEKLETILVVDDTPIVLSVVVAILDNANFNVLEAKSGEEAITSGVTLKPASRGHLKTGQL